MLQKKRKSGMVSTEVAIGLTLAVVVLFVAIGLFSESLSEMVASTNFKNISLSQNDSKTEFSYSNRDYSSSQINVQIMGEQGLAMLRRRANNKAIELMKEAFNNKKDADSIAYLSTAIKALTGEPHVCVYMKKDSDKLCKEDGIGGYNYNLALGSAALTIKKVNSAGTVISETAVLTINTTLGKILSGATISEDSSMKEKYDFIKNLSSDSAPYVRKDVILIRNFDAFNNIRDFSSSGNSDIIKGDLEVLYNSGIRNFVYRNSEDPVGYSTNKCGFLCINKQVNKDENVAIDYLISGEGKTITLDGFNKLLNEIESVASGNLHKTFDSSLGLVVVNNALKYARKATYNKFVYNVEYNFISDDVHDLSTQEVVFYNNGESDIDNGKISAKTQICFNYSFTSGPGNNKLGDSRDWAIAVVSYADSKVVISTYLKYFRQYLNQYK